MNISGYLLIILSILTVVIYSASSFGIGSVLKKFFKLPASNSVTFGLGHAFLALILQGLAVGSVFNLISVSIFILPTSLYGLFSLKKDFKRPVLPAGPLDWILVLSAITTILILTCELSFPGSDALAYYMAHPKLIAQAGGLVPLRGYEFFSVLPSVSEIPYAVAYLVGKDLFGQIAAKFFMAPVLLCLMIQTFQLSLKFKLNRTTASIIVAAIITSTSITLVAWDGKTDLISALYAITAASLLPSFDETKNEKSEYFVFGMMAAFAIIAKLSAALVLPFALGIPLLGYLYFRRDQILTILIPAVMGALLILVLGWWGRNLFLFGDPLAPILTLKKSTPNFPIEQSWFGKDATNWILMTYPFALTFGNYPMQHGGISPIWLVLLPGILFWKWNKDSFKNMPFLMAFGGVTGVLVWMIMRPSVIAPRYILPNLLLPFFFLGVCFELVKVRSAALSKLMKAGIMALLVLAIFEHWTVIKLMTNPYVKAVLKPHKTRSPLEARHRDLKKFYQKGEKILLLSYSSEIVPFENMSDFYSHSSVPKDNFWNWVTENGIKYIVYDPITHKNDSLQHPPTDLNVERIEYARDVYYLYVLKN